MANGGGNTHDAGNARVASRETNNHKQGRGAGAAIPKKHYRGDANPTKGGGINRATQGRSR